MSLESGRRLGLIASLITVIMPIVAIIAAVFLVLAQFATYPTTSSLSLFSSGLIIAVFALVAVTGFVGTILFVLAMHRLAQYYNEPGIYKNALYGFILNIIGTAIAYVLEFAVLAPTIGSIPQVSTPSAAAPLLTQIILSFLAVLGVILIFAIVSAVLYMRAFNKLAEKSGVDSFRTAGLLYLIGIVLTIVIVGGVIVWIAWIFAAMGFYSLKPKAPSTSTFTYSTPQETAPSIAQKRYCPYCGTENSADAIYCSSCGRQLQ